MTSKSNLVINPQRLWDSLMDTAKFGGTAKGGIKRLTVSDEDKRVRDWFKAQCEALGCVGAGRQRGQHVCDAGRQTQGCAADRAGFASRYAAHGRQV